LSSLPLPVLSASLWGGNSRLKSASSRCSISGRLEGGGYAEQSWFSGRWRRARHPDRGIGNGAPGNGVATERDGRAAVAQEVERVLPELVVEDGDGFKRVRYSDLPIYLLQALREQQHENDMLQEAVSYLSERMRALEQ
jgi:hypothetical protein